jgi:hypothetical protein
MPDLGTIAPPYRIGPWIGASTWLPNAKLAFVEDLSRGTSKIQSKIIHLTKGNGARIMYSC